MVQQSRRSRRQQRQQKRSQRGGSGSCSARPLNRQRFENKQRGGMAPIDTPGLLLDNATRVQAQVADLDRYIDDSQMLVRQAGGRRSQRQQRQQRQRKQRQRTQRRNRSNRSNRRSRNQRGGMQDFNASGMLLKPDQYAAAGLPREFAEFEATMPSYNQFTGAQPAAAKA